MRWYVGGNLFSSWRYENDAVWDANAALLREYEEVRP
jgi:hypothetical protein